MSIKRKNFMRTALLGSTAAAMAGAAMGVSGIAVAQGEEVETIIVTGSRIARADLSSVSPLSVVTAEEFRLSGSVNVEQLLNTLPQTIPGFDSSSNNPGNGTASVNLRGIGSGRTLVLVNGRRFIGSGFGAVDLNNIPASLIERVEVVTGGASAVYGSDAMAGVVNFILKSDFEGVQFDYQYSVSDEGDGDIHSISATFGGNFADGRGNATVFANYWKRNAVLADAREFSSVALGDTGVPGVFEPVGSSGVPSGTFGAFGSVAGISALPGDPCNLLPADSDSAGCRWDTDGNLIPFAFPADTFNFAPANFLQINGERWTFTANANFEVNQYFNAYTELNFVNNLVDNELAPTPVFTRLSIDIDSPFLSASSQAFLASLDTDGDGFVVDPVFRRRNVEVGPRQSINDRNAYRVVIGFDGTLDNGWRYDAYWSFARIGRVEQQEANINLARLRQAIATVPDGAGGIQCQAGSDAGCVPINYFGEGNVSDEAAAFIAIPVTNYTRNTQQIGSVSLTGDIFDLGSGPAGFAIGFEYRREFADFRPDFALSSRTASGFNQAQPVGGKFEVWELYAEVAVPLLSDMPGIELLEFTGAARFSDYTTETGTVYTYAAGLNWDVVDGFRLRAGYQRAIRAPNIAELFAGQGQNFPGAQDPCASQNFAGLVGANPNLGAACIANGAANPGGFFQPNSQIPSIIGGNPNLFEETADTFTVGFVAQPNFLPGLNITLDYYNIDISGFITAAAGGAQGILNACLITGDGSNSNVFCQLITRQSGGAVFQLQTLQANLGFLGTAGFDLQVDYNIEVSELGLGDDSGNLSIFFLGTHVIKNEFQAGPGLVVDDCAGLFGGLCGQPDPHWRFNTRVTWSKGPVAISSRWRFIGATTDDRITLGGAAPDSLSRAEIDAKNYFDLSFTYDYNQNFTIFGGIDNVFSNGPAIVGDVSEQSNTFPRTYPTLGAKFFIGGTARF